MIVPKGVPKRMVTNAHVAVVTGGAQGIGRKTAELLAGRGYRLAIIDLRQPVETIKAIEANGGEAMGCDGDITDEATVDRFAKRVFERFGRADVLVNNAGISLIAAAELTAVSDYRRVLEVNLVAPFLLAKVFGAMMLEAGSGSIVNVASVAGLLGIADRAAYNASKHGLIGLTRTLAAEWGGRGVRVNAVCPGWVKTEMDAADQAGAATATPISLAACPWPASRVPTMLRGQLPSSPTRKKAASSMAMRCRSMAAGVPMEAGSQFACESDRAIPSD